VRGRARERGAIAVVAALLVVAMATFLALVTNAAHLFSNRAKLQAAADSAALAGALSLDGTGAGMVEAKAMAVAFAGYHTVDTGTVAISAGDVTAGCWSSKATPDTKWDSTMFTPWGGASCSNVRDVNAVRVRDAQDGESGRNPEMSVFLGTLLNAASVKVRREAVAVAGGPCSAPSLPLVLAECQVLDANQNLSCTSTMKFANDKGDQIGLTTFGQGGSIDHTLDKGLYRATVGNIDVKNGNDLNCKVAGAMAEYLGQKVAIPVVSISGCEPPDGDPKFNGNSRPVVGFAQVTLRAVCGKNGNGNGGPDCNYSDKGSIDPATGQPWACPPGKRSIVISVDCSWLSTSRDQGCRSYGARSDYARLVR
jgi:hypothetical protein